MTNEEAKKVAEILVQADGICSLCSHCAGALCEMFLEWKPEFLVEVKEAWRNHFDSEYEP